jgi:hypothetical protein
MSRTPLQRGEQQSWLTDADKSALCQSLHRIEFISWALHDCGDDQSTELTKESLNAVSDYLNDVWESLNRIAVNANRAA